MDDQALDILCSNFVDVVTISSHGTEVYEDEMVGIRKQDSDSLVADVDEGETLIHKQFSESQDSGLDKVKSPEIVKNDTDMQDSGELDSDRDIVELDGDANTQPVPACHEQALQLKLKDVSNKVEIIRKEKELLCTEVKNFTADNILSLETLDALQKIGTENQQFKTKCLEEIETLKKKCLEECSQRKKLYNEVIELRGNIRVFCRCRPLKQGEVKNGASSVVDFDSSQENELQVISADSTRKQFKFDHVFRPEDDQEAIFVQTQPIVTSVLDGYNVCIFAYGQTGTGKTYTMDGTPENRGVNYRTLEELFRLSQERSSIMRLELFVSMLEVYNEKIRDLLVENPDHPAKKLEIKQSAEGTQEVPGLVESRVYRTDDVWDLLKRGSRARSVGSTNANESSSRSHSLLRVTVMGENLLNGQRTKSHLWLVDLAGSERISRTEVEGERLKESQFINKSLSALGDVISSLASKTSHVPYRNSKLTHMLQSSLGGDCKTLMFVQISPNAADVGETLCSLNFASRVRGVEHGPAKKQTDNSELLKYKQLAEKAKQDEKEMKKLQDSLQSMQMKMAARENICRNLQDKVRDLENQLAEERKTRQKQENRALATLSSLSSLPSSNQAERRPPLAPTKLRMPLRIISNIPNQAPTSNKSRMSVLPAVDERRDNTSRMGDDRGKQVMRVKRCSYVAKPESRATSQAVQPRRRASFATFRRDSNQNPSPPPRPTSQVAFQPRRRVSVAIMRPASNLNPSPLGKSKGIVGRTSNLWDPLKVRRMLSSPLSRDNSTAEATPFIGAGSKFKGSPPSRTRSWKPKHPTVIALQKKTFVWSPLKMKMNRKA